MKINTKFYGELDILEDKIIRFEEGIPAFEDEKEFVLIFNEEDDSGFKCLQSVNDENLAFIVINPFEIFIDYDIQIPKATIEKLKIQNNEDIAVYSFVVIPEDVGKITTNLSAPIVINLKEKLGKQVILDDSRYKRKQSIYETSLLGGK